MSEFRYYKCEGPALELLKAYRIEMEILIAGRKTLEHEYVTRMNAHQEYHQSNLRSIWRRMAAMVGLDPNKTWGTPEYQLETRYLDDGFGAILYIPQAPNPIKEALGGESSAEVQNPEADLPTKTDTVH